jgi:glycosyltransferase involved in cell wall biosynthesis
MGFKISIITPAYNRVSFVEQAIENVLAQGYQNFEHIIIDGASTDGTLEVLKKYQHLTVVTEPDLGMYDALNKGLDRASGEIVGFLNTDDLYAPNIFHRIVNEFGDRNLDAVSGQAVFYEKEEPEGWIEKMRLSPSPPKDLYRQIILSGCLMNAWFFRREVCLKTGKFDSKYKISGDADFMIRLRLNDFRYKLLDFPIYHYYSHSDSLTMDLNVNKLQKILKDNGILAESFISKDFVPEEVKNLLAKNYLNIGNLLADKYLEKAMFKEILELAKLLGKYDHQWGTNYIQDHQENWADENVGSKLARKIKVFFGMAKKGK